MSNSFVDYLNSMNNASSNTINALAESQVTNKYYDEIRVERNLGKYISNSIKNNEKKVFILTGHAGDGKTSILVQVLKDLNMLKDGEQLKIADEVKKNELELFYVKDMSELSPEKQQEFLLKALAAPKLNKASILISNTGPLINTFKNIMDIDDVEIETILLNQMDINTDKDIDLEEYTFKLINIARIDNISFVRSIVTNMLKDNVWETCNSCDKQEKCPINVNYKCMKQNYERIVKFLENYYRWLYENDKRMTIRQIVSQISYSITGNLTCKDVSMWQKATYASFNYNFANLFFGYRGIYEIDVANQIKGIEQLKRLKLDEIALDSDYDLFVKNDYNCFPQYIRNIVKETWNNFSMRYHTKNVIEENAEANDISIIENMKMRKAIRRFYLMYSLYEKERELDNVFHQIYGGIFPQYIDSMSRKLTSIEKKPIKNLIFDALYISNMGVTPKKRDRLYLTLKREDGAFQNVFLQLGQVDSKQIEIVQEKTSTSFDDVDEKYGLFLELDKNKNFRFPLNLPILTYFKATTDGAINTNINPALTHGIAKLNALLLSKFKESCNEDQVKLIINTINEPVNVECVFENNKLFIEGR